MGFELPEIVSRKSQKNDSNKLKFEMKRKKKLRSDNLAIKAAAAEIERVEEEAKDIQDMS